jgi:transcriptional regulator with XRE-family HTH domain
MTAEKGFFATRLKQLRDGAGLSQPELAERSGVAVGTVRQFEQGRREPTYATLAKLAAGLGVSLSAFDPPAQAEPPAKPKRARKPKGK